MKHPEILAVQPLDCFRILCLLNAKNLNNAEVARIIGADESTTRQWKRGPNQPRDPHARRLVALFQLYYPDMPIPEKSDCIHAQEETGSVQNDA